MQSDPNYPRLVVRREKQAGVEASLYRIQGTDQTRLGIAFHTSKIPWLTPGIPFWATPKNLTVRFLVTHFTSLADREVL